MSDLERDDPTFAADLRESQHTVWRVAQWLSDKGFDVAVRAVRVRPSVEDLADYGDDGDIEVIERVEVKRRDLDFTCAADYPFPTVIVDPARAYDRARIKPKCHVLVNRAGTVAALVHRSSFAHWKKVTRFDRTKNRERENYECPLEFVTFEPFPKGGLFL